MQLHPAIMESKNLAQSRLYCQTKYENIRITFANLIYYSLHLLIFIMFQFIVIIPGKTILHYTGVISMTDLQELESQDF